MIDEYHEEAPAEIFQRETQDPPMVDCQFCQAKGSIASLPEPTYDDRVVEYVPDPCPECGGSGKVRADHQYHTVESEHQDSEGPQPIEPDEEPFEGVGSDDPDLERAGDEP